MFIFHPNLKKHGQMDVQSFFYFAIYHHF